MKIDDNSNLDKTSSVNDEQQLSEQSTDNSKLATNNLDQEAKNSKTELLSSNVQQSEMSATKILDSKFSFTLKAKANEWQDYHEKLLKILKKEVSFK